MKKLYTFLFIFSFILGNAQKYSSFRDTRNNIIYKTVNILDQIWMAENLNVDMFQNGDKIRKVNSKQEWMTACLRKEPVWMYFENIADNGKKFGKIYNYYAIIDKRNLAPVNYRIPTYSDFLALSNLSVLNLKSQSGWYKSTYTRKVFATINKIDRNGFPYADVDYIDREFTTGGSGNNSSGFNAFPSGIINKFGNSELFGEEVCFWSSSNGNITNSQSVFRLTWDDNISHINNASFTQGFYVRCVSGKTQEEIKSDKIQKIQREQFLLDSLKKERIRKEIIKKQALDLEIAITKRIKDSIDLKYDDSLRNTLQILDVYKDGIVIKVDGNGHGIIISTLQLINKVDAPSDNWINLMLNKLSENGWELPVKGGEVISIFEKMYKNENFRYKFKGSKEKEYFRFSMHYNNKENVMAFLVGNMPWELLGKSNEDYSKKYFFGFKSF
jgi:uncharacterized protein (TIGR02145 family)